MPTAGPTGRPGGQKEKWPILLAAEHSSVEFPLAENGVPSENGIPQPGRSLAVGLDNLDTAPQAENGREVQDGSDISDIWLASDHGVRAPIGPDSRVQSNPLPWPVSA